MHRACECEPLCSCLRPHYRQAGTGPASRLGLGRRGSAGSRPVTTHTRSCCHLCPKEEPPTAHAGVRGPAHLCDPPPPRSARLTPLPATASSQWAGHWLFPPAPHSAGCDRPAGPRPRTGLLTALPAALPPTPRCFHHRGVRVAALPSRPRTGLSRQNASSPDSGPRPPCSHPSAPSLERCRAHTGALFLGIKKPRRNCC